MRWPLFYVMRKILFLKSLFYSQTHHMLTYLMKSDEKPLRPLWVFRLWFSCHNGQLFTTYRKDVTILAVYEASFHTTQTQHAYAVHTTLKTHLNPERQQ